MIKKWTKGNGEMIGFSVVSVCILFVFMIMVSVLQLSVGLNAITKIMNVVGRSAAICTSMEDAREQIQIVAESVTTFSGVDNLETDVEYATENQNWESGNLLKITVRADVSTLSPFIPFSQTKSTLVAIDNATGNAIIIPEGMGTEHSYMGWHTITARGTKQYKLREESRENYDGEGFAKIGDRYVIACTTLYGQVGDYVDFYRKDGTVLKTIIGDIKNQNDSGCNIYGHKEGKCVVEFIVNRSWYENGRGSHVNPGTAGCHPEWGYPTARIVKAIKLNKNFFNEN